MGIKLEMGPAAFASYKRLAYEWWYAFAEFVDNSTQAYLDNKKALDKAYAAEKDKLTVRIVADDENEIRIIDNSMGMSLKDLQHGLSVAMPPDNPTGRCRYGMGMKTAASWIGNRWTVRTKKLGESKEYSVEVNVDSVARGSLDLPFQQKSVSEDKHYTIISIYDHHRPLRGRTIGKVKDFLRSIYRSDISEGLMKLEYNDVVLDWHEYTNDKFLKRPDGSLYRKEFSFEIESDAPGKKRKAVTGWVGILDPGSRASAGFSILHRKRVIKGWPDSWRPYGLFGEGRNDLVNQRLVGEINLEDFEVSHTKDAINWYGDEEELIDKELVNHCLDFARKAKEHRKGPDPHGPSTLQVDAAVKTLEQELTSPEFIEALQIAEVVPPPESIHKENQQIIQGARRKEPVLTAKLGNLVAKVYLQNDGSSHEPYFVSDSENPDSVQVVINTLHPHWGMMTGDGALENYMRHCIYDAIAEHRARHRSALEPDTIKRIKDQYLRVAFQIVQRPEGEPPKNGQEPDETSR